MIHKTTRSILSVLLAALLLVTSTPLTPAFADGGAHSLQSANNESRELEQVDGVYQIGSADELREFAKLVNGGKTDADAILTADIDLNPGVTFKEDGSYSGPDEEEPHQWTPIGSDSRRYSGNFNGNGKTISGLYIDSSDNDYKGLFGYLSTDGDNTGTVQDLSVSGDINGKRYVGGVVGRNGGNVINCTFSGSVSGKISVGGVVGGNSGSNGVVENCYNTGTVTGTRIDDYLGGVGGVVGYNSGTVKNCYNTGKVTGSADSSDVGGVVGWNRSSVTNCYNSGSVSGGISVGGVVGYNDGGRVENCYFLKTETVNKDLQGIGDEAHATGATVVNDLSDLCEALEDDPWTTSPFCKHPVLKTNPEGGLGTKEHPYEIKTIDQLKTFRDIVNGANEQVKDSDAHAKLMNDIDLKDVCGESNSWTPIGTSESTAYTGTFDGDGHTISGLNINNDYRGLFGYVGNTGTVQNLSVSGSVSGHLYVGGIAGQNNGNVINCAFSGSVSGVSFVGGVVGYNGGTVKNCYNTGTVTGTVDSVGGVVGYNDDGIVKNCYNTGDVSGNNYVGGVVGYNDDGIVTGCIFSGSGTVTGTGDYVGGVVGQNFGGTVENCYNTGSVTVTGSDGRVGGVVGYNSFSATVTGCYFLQGTAKSGIGENDGSGDATATAKDRATFHSGEVAWLLQAGQKAAGVEDPIPQVWGQSNLTTDKSWPTLIALDNSAHPVYKVTFDYGTSFADNDGRYAYSYTNGVVSKPTKNPELAGHTLSGWYSDPSLTTAWTFDTEISNDTTLYAKWTENAPDPDPEPTPDPEPEEPPYSGKYSYELSTSVGDHGTLAVDRYATEGEKVTITVTPDEAYKLDDLSVTAGGKEVALTAGGDGTYTFTMPSADVKISATFAEDPDWTEPEEPATDVSDIFLDVTPNAWYKDAIQYAYDQGLMTGVSDTEFAPEATTTRAMIVSILARLEGVTTAQAAGFADVTDEWYATAVNWAANVGVVNGYEDNTFQPNTAITREQLAAILMNYAAYKGEDVSNRADLANYTDQPSTWAQEAMSWAVAEGLISGVTNTELQPQGNATRAQVAAILQRYLEA